MDYLRERDNEIFRVVDLVIVADYALLHGRGYAIVDVEAVYRAVLLVDEMIELRHVNSAYLSGSTQEFEPCRALLLHLVVEVHELEVDLLALTKHEQVKEVRERLGVTDAWTSRNDYLTELLRPVAGKYRYPREVEHIQYVRVGELVLQREADEVKIAYGVEALECVERYAVLAHYSLKVLGRREAALAPVVLALVGQRVQYLHAEVRHSDVVCVGEAEREADVDLRLVLYHAPDLAAYVARGLLHLEKVLLNFCF